ncbi:hypothetical protein HAV15_008872 [Penicillium sp. str. |nr:hypothetical protein HAV15_008872 [Penicillium sp. str. \
MLAGANLQDREEFWGEAVATATYTRNLSPSHAFDGKVPLIGLYPNLTPSLCARPARTAFSLAITHKKVPIHGLHS